MQDASTLTRTRTHTHAHTRAHACTCTHGRTKVNIHEFACLPVCCFMMCHCSILNVVFITKGGTSGLSSMASLVLSTSWSTYRFFQLVGFFDRICHCCKSKSNSNGATQRAKKLRCVQTFRHTGSTDTCYAYVASHRPKTVTSATFSPDGRFIVTGTQSGGKNQDQINHKKGTATLWDATSGKRLVVYKHDGPVESVTFSHDGNFILTTCHDETGYDNLDYAMMWDATLDPSQTKLVYKDQCVAIFPHPGICLANFSADGCFVVTTSGQTRVWDVKKQRSLPYQRRAEYNSDKDDAKWKTFTILPIEEVSRPLCTNAAATFCKSQPGHDYLMMTLTEEHKNYELNDYAAVGTAVRLWTWSKVQRSCMVTPGLFRTIANSCQHSFIQSACLSPDGLTVATGECKYALYNGELRHAPRGSIDPNGKRELTVCIYDVASGSCRHVFCLPGAGSMRDACVISLSFSPDSKFIVVAWKGASCKAYVWELASRERIHVYDPPEAPTNRAPKYNWKRIKSASFSQDGNYILIVGREKVVIWESPCFVQPKPNSIREIIIDIPQQNEREDDGHDGQATKKKKSSQREVKITRQDSREKWGIVFARPRQDGTVLIQEVVRDSPAHRSGLSHGSAVLSIDGRSIDSLAGQVTATLMKHRSTTLTMEVQTKGSAKKSSTKASTKKTEREISIDIPKPKERQDNGHDGGAEANKRSQEAPAKKGDRQGGGHDGHAKKKKKSSRSSDGDSDSDGSASEIPAIAKKSSTKSSTKKKDGSGNRAAIEGTKKQSVKKTSQKCKSKERSTQDETTKEKRTKRGSTKTSTKKKEGSAKKRGTQGNTKKREGSVKKRSTKGSSKKKGANVARAGSEEIGGFGFGDGGKCAYASANGNCPRSSIDESVYCTSHTCPQCYEAKTSREYYCKKCTDSWNTQG